jgi:hypothetical protein
LQLCNVCRWCWDSGKSTCTTSLTHLLISILPATSFVHLRNFRQWVNNHCEGAVQPIHFNPGYPSDPTKWCGALSVVGNTYAAMGGQGAGCRLNGSTAPFCRDGGTAGPPFSIGGQCEAGEAELPPACADLEPRFEACRTAAGVGGICYNDSGLVQCLSAVELANTNTTPCIGYSGKCTIYS